MKWLAGCVAKAIPSVGPDPAVVGGESRFTTYLWLTWIGRRDKRDWWVAVGQSGMGQATFRGTGLRLLLMVPANPLTECTEKTIGTVTALRSEVDQYDGDDMTRLAGGNTVTPTRSSSGTLGADMYALQVKSSRAVQRMGGIVRKPNVVEGLVPEIRITEESISGDVNEIEIAGVRYRREGLDPKREGVAVKSAAHAMAIGATAGLDVGRNEGVVVEIRRVKENRFGGYFYIMDPEPEIDDNGSIKARLTRIQDGEE